MFECFALALGCGVIAAIYRGLLAYEPILNWWFKFGNQYEKRWFFAPVWGCVKCISGQLALWSYLLTPISEGWQSNPVGVLFGLVLTICGAILTAIVLAPIIAKLK
jgi:hypothetical protein